MIRDIFEVPDVEHIGDLEHFTGIIQGTGGEIVKVNCPGIDRRYKLHHLLRHSN